MPQYALDLNRINGPLFSELERISDVKGANTCIVMDKDANAAAMRIGRSLAIFFEKYLTEVKDDSAEMGHSTTPVIES